MQDGNYNVHRLDTNAVRAADNPRRNFAVGKHVIAQTETIRPLIPNARRAGVRRNRRLSIGGVERGPAAHQLFKFPAKFHPPVTRKLVHMFSKPGGIVLDPFCGSGTLLLEAAMAGRRAIGIDIDPLAVFISRVKSTRVRPALLRSSYVTLAAKLEPLRRHPSEYRRRQHQDIRECAVEKTLKKERLWVPAIPNIHHWFRRYVVVDLARLLRVIETTRMPETHRAVFRLCFASIIRASSNADPVPVSGLEVTSHMLERDKQGRVIDPFSLFDRAAGRAVNAFEELWGSLRGAPPVRVLQGTAIAFGLTLPQKIDAVITSPPYHNAVDYYRRHTLEMYWLRFVKDQASRLALRPGYIGHVSVRRDDPLVTAALPKSALVAWWARQMMAKDRVRGTAFRHYVQAMHQCFAELAYVLKPDAAAVFVVGRSQWNGYEIRTERLFEAVAGPAFRLEEVLWYPVKNRYMSYSRHNGANINRELVLVFRRIADHPAEGVARNRSSHQARHMRGARRGQHET